ncbi:hypothetical protein BMS3Bbin12_01290 [bacterium BMS3Bbin12]|nr:hypothetical protein BMS3Abin12_00450 [bacterium BMS3Abin12]GBE48115.1 hypothetical protein BMS3Bbin12_01290 [bacterium BMS3Bbin12]GBE50050.1 hypothetical protein BMS3Bbin13_00975 [bacterium BMS3Bbin13]HDJ86479.1 transcription antitermination factor NusB [Chromatiales bacterium]HDK02461.1 transcription antitermination factor NusB [Gammaproteobacteria bacterium]
MAGRGAVGGGAHQARSWARRRAVQALYQWDLTGQDLTEIEAQFHGGQEMDRADVGYFRELLHQVPACLDELRAALAPCLERPFEALDPVERTILLIGGYELGHRREIPYRVVISEAVSLAQMFGAEDGFRFVNGVLDRLARALRAAETAGGR